MTPTNTETSVSAYLLTEPRKRPDWLGGERFWCPDEFGYLTANRPVWDSVAKDWIYSWMSDDERKVA